MPKLVKVYLGIGIAIAGIGSVAMKKRKPEVWNNYSLDAKVNGVAAVILAWPIYLVSARRRHNESES